MKARTLGTLIVFALGITAGVLAMHVGIPAGAEEPPKRSPVEP